MFECLMLYIRRQSTTLLISKPAAATHLFVIEFPSAIFLKVLDVFFFFFFQNKKEKDTNSSWLHVIRRVYLFF